MSNIARRLVALEKQAPQAGLAHEVRLARLLSKGGGSLLTADAPLSSGERQRIAEKVQALRG